MVLAKEFRQAVEMAARARRQRKIEGGAHQRRRAARSAAALPSCSSPSDAAHLAATLLTATPIAAASRIITTA